MLTVKGRSAMKGSDVPTVQGVTAVPQLEDIQVRLPQIRVHNPVRVDAELLVRGFLPVQIDEGSAGRPDLDHEQRRAGELRAADLVMRTTTRSGSNSVCGPSSTAGSGTTQRSSGQAPLKMPYSRPPPPGEPLSAVDSR